MRKLTRPSAPIALKEAKNHYARWDDFAKKDKPGHAAVADALRKDMQSGRCAYCEDKTPANEGHIEHFRKRADHPELTFVWDNLYYSCGKKGSCGHYKDKLPKRSRRYDDLIAPCADNPEDFLTFALDGTIIIAENVSDENRRRAETTIRVFNLNEAGLKERRRAQWRCYKFLQNYPEEIDKYLNELKGEAFITMLYHLCRKRMDGADFSAERAIKRKR